MTKKILSQLLFLFLGASAALAGPQMIAFERKDAVWIANLDGTGEKKIADGIFPAISPEATRLTPKKLFGWDGVWIDNNNILFLSKADGEKEDSIYRMSIDGKNLKRLIKNGRFPSVSAATN